MPVLTPTKLESALAKLPGWTLTNGEIRRRIDFKDFLTAMAFVNHVADLAEAAQHHPDIDIRWNKVTLALVTHDEGGITEKDTRLAKEISALVD